MNSYRHWEDEVNSWDADPRVSMYGGYQSPDSAQAVNATLAKGAVDPNAVSNAGAGLTTAGTATANPYIAGAGLGLQTLGLGLGAYGAYKQGEQAEKDYQLQRENFELEKSLGLQDRLLSDEERRRRAMLESGNYAGDYLQRAMQNYGGYNRMRG